MGEKYLECHKTHKILGGKSDGCQEYMEVNSGLNCGVCGCHRNFHRKVEVAYRCHKMHASGGSQPYVCGCQEFEPDGTWGLCAVCQCKKGFHRAEAIAYK